MNNEYEFVGSVCCSGTLDNGKNWSGVRGCFATLKNGVPFTVKVFKVNSSVADDVFELESGTRVRLLFDDRGRVARVLSD